MRAHWDDLDRATDSPDPSVAEHVRRYLDTDATSGFTEGGVSNLLLTTVGRASGALRRTALFFGEDGDRYVLVASGSTVRERHPSWYLNLVAHPEVHVQVRAERVLVTARTVAGPERARLWRLMCGVAPVYRMYEARSRREIPVVVLDRHAG